MRPARKGPENREPEPCPEGQERVFNEAGPQGAGKPHAREAVRLWMEPFNEAGPQGAGKPRPGPIWPAPSPAPSMRPARKGPENPPRVVVRLALPLDLQ